MTSPDTLIDVTLWRTFSRGRHYSYTWREFIDTFVRDPEISKDKKKVAGYSLGRFEGNRRSLPNVHHVHALVLDFDEGDTTVQQALDFFPGTWRVVYTTFRHKPEYPKLRVIIPLARTVDADEYERLWIWAEKKIKGHKLDEGARDASRFWYLPSHPPGAEYEWLEGVGTVFDPDPALATVPATTHSRPLSSAKGSAKPRMVHERLPRADIDDSADETFFGRAFAFADMSFDLLPNGALSVVCPWADQHTCGSDGDSSTVILPATTEARWGLFKCSHAHCARRLTTDLLDVLPVEALDEARAAHGRGMVRVRVIDGWAQHLPAAPETPPMDRFILKCRPREAAPFNITVKERSSVHVDYLDSLPLELLVGRRLDLSLEGKAVKAMRLIRSDLSGMTSVQKRARGTAILSAHAPGSSVDGPDYDFLFELLLQHPKLEEKIGPGVRRIRVRGDGSGKALEIVRRDGSSVEYGLKMQTKMTEARP